ncbi:hypothetical protein Bca101_075551 [Brassica carinata]
MVFLPDDLCAAILSRLPIKVFTSFKLVCKQWNSVVESQIFRNLFISQHQNTQSSSWSLIKGASNRTEFLAHYRCKTWGLQRSLESYISSFISYKFENQRGKYRRGSVVAYSDAGFVLIDVSSYRYSGSTFEKRSLCVANPVSQECIEIDVPKAFENSGIFWPFGIATRTDNGVVISYKIVAYSSNSDVGYLVYSSETGLWSPLPYNFERCECNYTISLNGNLHWLSRNNDELVSMDFNATTMEAGLFRYTAFPDLEKRVKFKRACTTYQGSLMYMNIVSQDNDDGSVDHKLCCVFAPQRWAHSEISSLPGRILFLLIRSPTMAVSVTQSLVVIDVVFLVAGLLSIVSARLGFQDLVFGDLTSMLIFIAFEDGSTVLIVFFSVYVLCAWKVVYGLKLRCAELVFGALVSSIQSFVALRLHECLVCA